MKISSDVVRVLRRARHAWRGTRRDGEIYCIRPDYRSRIRPKYFLHAFDGINWQPDVYPKAAEIAAQSGARRIVDLGCGNGEKLVALHPRFEIVGIDFGANLDRCRALYPFARWLEHDLDSEAPLPVLVPEAQEAVFIASDVIEHLRHPERMLTRVRELLGHEGSLILSTPERALTWGGDHSGPPPNLSHVREWTVPELREFLVRCGFEHVHIELTRSNDQSDRRETMLAIARPRADV